MAQPTVSPIAQNQTNQTHVTPPWFVQDSEYNVLPGKFELLINGEEAFGAVYDAIASAKKSICIICWGFQPSMYFKRGAGESKTIGALLEEKAYGGVKVRVLSWVVDTLGFVDMAGAGGEGNTAGRRAWRYKDRAPTMTDKMYEEDRDWFERYANPHGDERKGRSEEMHLRAKAAAPNLQFVGRGYGPIDRARIAGSHRADDDTGKTTRTVQAASPSHHQKTVLIDFEDPDRAVGFVMGHNMLDEYWDRSDHSIRRFDDPRQGRNGSRPREDFSSRIKGPMLGDLFHNFNSAWKKETGEDLSKSLGKPVFERYPLSGITREQEEKTLREEIDRERALQEELRRGGAGKGTDEQLAESKQRLAKAEADERRINGQLSALDARNGEQEKLREQRSAARQQSDRERALQDTLKWDSAAGSSDVRAASQQRQATSQASEQQIDGQLAGYSGDSRQREQLRQQLTTAHQQADRERALQADLERNGGASRDRELAESTARLKKLEDRERELKDRFAAVTVAESGTAIMGQILRTQPQYGKRDIAKCYLQAVNNATQYIYIENQYFRWPVLAEKITAHAKVLSESERDPAKYGSLYLFVITNADSEGMGSGTVNTARMLENLGRADVLPEVSRQQRAEDTAAKMNREEQVIRSERAHQSQLTPLVARDTNARKKIEASRLRQQAAETRKAELQQKLAQQQADQKDSRRVIVSEQRAGLKVHVASLVAPDSPGRSGSTVSDERAVSDEKIVSDEKKRGLTREERTAKAKNDLADANAKLVDLRMQRNQEQMGDLQRPNGTAPSKALGELDRQIKAEESRRDNLRQELNALNDGSNPIDWVDVYIHAKLMIIDDTFMTVGSANINSRSMETDSELNIAHANHLISNPTRKTLWGLHTKGRDGASFSGAEVMNKEGMKAAYDNWKELMNKNKDNRKLCRAPIASLVEFFSGTKDRSDMD